MVFYDKPFLKFDRLLETYFSQAPKGLKSFLKAMPLWLKEKIYFKKLLKDNFKKFSTKIPPIYFCEHHLSHAASAFYPSPFEKAAILCIDGVGEWATTSAWLGSKNNITPLFEIQYPHSLGLLYSAFTGYLGFKVNSGEYKMMGLAPYGKPIYKEIILKELIHIHEDGSFQLNFKYLNFTSNGRMTNIHFEKLFSHAPRKIDDPLLEFHKNLAASIQEVTEIVVLKLAAAVKKQTNADHLTLAGGVALNCVANGILKKVGLFEQIWVQPASGDSGGALGAALSFYYLQLKKSRTIAKDVQQGSMLGPSFKDDEIKLILEKYNMNYFYFKDENSLNKNIVEHLIDGKVIGFFQGRMEYGPRALGCRSIIGDPRGEKMQSTMNLKIKKRESFRPFAPIVLKERVEEFFHWNKNDLSPYMLFTTNTKENVNLPAVTHIDGSARLQVVDQDIHPRLHRLLKKFDDKSNCPVLINTSFNVRGEPIVCHPLEAISCFMTTEMDVLVLESFILEKSQQNALDKQWESAFEKD